MQERDDISKSSERIDFLLENTAKRPWTKVENLQPTFEKLNLA